MHRLPCAKCDGCRAAPCARVDGRPVPAGLFDFALYFWHNAHALLERGSGPYFYLPKIQSHLEARLWNEVFLDAQIQLGIPRGSIKVSSSLTITDQGVQLGSVCWVAALWCVSMGCAWV